MTAMSQSERSKVGYQRKTTFFCMIQSCISYYNHPFGGSQIVLGVSKILLLQASLSCQFLSFFCAFPQCLLDEMLRSASSEKKNIPKSLETDGKACFPEIQNPKLLHHLAPKSCNICEVLGFNKALVNRDTARGLSPRPRKLQAVEPE